ncbi:unnamed protein product, partial [Mesorhabditis belari]|uniref:Glycosyl-hydrolase family 116 catalytic region domain-containing protein n=1 Tax=Mesorhabditis belari TaxID=2138241 RepID=A0AAF3F1T7_9BILA
MVVKTKIELINGQQLCYESTLVRSVLNNNGLQFYLIQPFLQEPHLSPYTQALMKRRGRFGYLESWEYRMVTTYDVHFYASYAIASLWPDLELTIQAEFTDQVGHSAEKEIRFHMEGDKAPLKSRARVPHDLGNPAQDPWLLTNAYVMHDTGKWKDLNLKFVLTSWRDYVILTEKNRKFLDHVYPAVKLLINDTLDCWDQDRDGMIENFGKADQTYDAWQMEGVSALRATIYELNVCKFGDGKMGAVNGMRPDGTLDRARDSLMANQLCGIWDNSKPEKAFDAYVYMR